ncbi:hypothetical protein SSX86_007582 [Deinandra increscens subsp. villosa]|uniref:FCP1 homology domain-containing protein n=1 Tax=Deinandra increscens subsp. villosa TaxID=3103831 RepID=A0AAP0H376_9ASTR
MDYDCPPAKRRNISLENHVDHSEHNKDPNTEGVSNTEVVVEQGYAFNEGQESLTEDMQIEHFDIGQEDSSKSKNKIVIEESELDATDACSDQIKKEDNSCGDDGGSHSRKKLLVLDINGLLVDIVAGPDEAYKPDTIIGSKAVFKRPFCDEFLKFCFERFSVGVWTSRTRRNIERVLQFLSIDIEHQLLFCWDQSHCTDTGFNTVDNSDKPLVLKELKKLWEKQDPNLPWHKGVYNESNTIFLDDSPYKALRNPPYTAIFPYSYSYRDTQDNGLVITMSSTYRDRSHCTDTGFSTVENSCKTLILKEIRKLWQKNDPDLPWEIGEYDESNTLLVENAPNKALLNPPHTAIFPYPYRYWNTKDDSLGPKGDLRDYLERLAASENVQKFVSENPFGQRPITERNLSWKYYQKVILAFSSKFKVRAHANGSADAKCKTSSELKPDTATALAAPTLLEPEADHTSVSAAPTILEPETDTTTSDAQTAVKPQTNTTIVLAGPTILEPEINTTTSDAQTSLEPETDTTTVLAAQTSLERQTDTTTVSAGPALLESEIDITTFDAQTSLEPDACTATVLAAKTSLELQTDTTTVLAGPTILEPEMDATTSDAQTSLKRETSTTTVLVAQTDVTTSDAQTSLEPEACTATVLAAQTSLEPQTNTTTVLAGPTILEPEMDVTTSDAQTSLK